MENKPLVTCHGDQTLFAKLHSTIIHGLPRETVEWQRPYGRPVRQIYVEANFVPFNPGILPGEDDWTLLGRPFFHIYITDCDVDTYKASVKEEISEWINALKEKNIPDWLVVVASNEESKVKSKILRTSVYDKVKSDFCGKNTERCVVLNDPFKSDIKTTESWSLVMLRMRHLLLLSYNRNLSRFEDHMRNERERRTEPGWSFFQYFMLQEELAFMYEMLGMYEDALVQYDELDALFTQFLLNHNAGHHAGWIADLASRKCLSWNGLCLSQPINIDKRQLIKVNEAALLDFRDYLFSRQCTSLFLQFKPWEVAKRSIPFLHNCLKEIKMLSIQLPVGAVDCWVFLSCLEVLRTCEKFSESGHMEAYSLYTASLWDYARTKMHEVGFKCLLMPGMDADASQSIVQGLLEGLNDIQAPKEGISEPVEKLKEALSSNTTFYQHYLEFSELAMGTYKHIGRIRSARSIGMDLAVFYMKLEEYQKAEGFLYDALKTFKEEGWDRLADNTRLHIAQCQKHLNTQEKYAKTCLHIAASKYLESDIRLEHQRELIKAGEEHEGDPFLLRLRPALLVHKIAPVSKTFTMHKPCVVSMVIHSSLPEPIHCDSIAISIVYESPLLEHTTDAAVVSGDRRRRNISGQSLKHHRRQSSSSSTQGIEFYNHVSETKRKVSQTLDLQVDTKHESRAVSSSGLVCRSPFRRMDSGPKGFADKELVKEDFGKAFVVNDVELKPGENELEMTGHLGEKGRYLLGQLCVSTSGFEMLKSFLPDYITFNLVCDDPALSLQPVKHPIIAGVPHEVSLTLLTGSHTLHEGSRVLITPADGLQIWGDAVKDGTLLLHEAQEYEERKFTFWVFSDIRMTHCDDENMRYHLKAALEDVGGSFHFDLNVVNPIIVKQELRTAGTKKFIHLVIKGRDETQLEISDYKLATDNTDIELTLLNLKGQVLRVDKDHSASYMWQLKSNLTDGPLFNCNFSFTYKLISDIFHDLDPKNVTFSFDVENYSTQFAVKSNVSPKENENFCSMGNPYDLEITVKDIRKTDVNQSERFMYEVHADQTLWALAGKTTGVFEMNGKLFSETIEATPLAGGNLPLPIVNLAHYCKTDEEGRDAKIENFSSGQVYNCSLSKHVYVVPKTNLSPVDISTSSVA